MKKVFLTMLFLALMINCYSQSSTLRLKNFTASTITVIVGAGVGCTGSGPTVTLEPGASVAIPPIGPAFWGWTGVSVLSGGSGGFPSPCWGCGAPFLVGISATWLGCGSVAEAVNFYP